MGVFDGTSGDGGICGKGHGWVFGRGGALFDGVICSVSRGCQEFSRHGKTGQTVIPGATDYWAVLREVKFAECFRSGKVMDGSYNTSAHQITGTSTCFAVCRRTDVLHRGSCHFLLFKSLLVSFPLPPPSSLSSPFSPSSSSPSPH